MILDRRILKEIGFLAIATLEPGRKIEAHVDPMEEIYFVLQGTGEMGVDDEKRQVGPGDATWIPTGSSHSLLNNGDEKVVILVVASSNW
jgi:mannose-6-phosphate isomerase-like protein (cupin superfamily)